MKKSTRMMAFLCVLAVLIQSLSFTSAMAAGQTEAAASVVYELAREISAGERYVIVSNGYALVNETASVPTASGGLSLKSAAVTVSDGYITSEVTDNMIWDFAEGTSSLAGPYATGFFITNGASKYLSRGSSGGTGVAGLNTSTYDASNVATRPHYCYWAFEDVNAATSTKSMFLFSSNPSDYVFFIRGGAEGFDVPGTAQDNMQSALAGYTAQLYKVKDAGGGTDPEDPGELLNTLLFMSDLHQGVRGVYGSSPVDETYYPNLERMLYHLTEEGLSADAVGFGGDYVLDSHAARVNYGGIFNTIDGLTAGAFPGSVRTYTMGNHDWEAGSQVADEAAFKDIFGYDRAGLAYNGDNYDIYTIGAETDDSSTGKKETFSLTDIADLDAHLESVAGSGKIVFIQTHWPLHRAFNWTWRNITNADKVIETLNKYGDDLDIVWLWGHNHYTDSNRQTILTRGDTLTYGAGLSADIKFTYANVGCMNDMYPNQTGLKETESGPASCLSVFIYEDKIKFEYNKLVGAGLSTETYSHDATIVIKSGITVGTYNNPSVVYSDLLNFDPVPDGYAVSVGVGSIVSGCAAKIPVKVTGEGDITVSFLNGGDPVSVPVADGEAMIALSKAPEPKTCVIAAYVDGRRVASSTIKVVKLPDNIWEAATADVDSKLAITFNADFELKDNIVKVTIGGEPVQAVVTGRNIVTEAAYASVAPGTKIVVAGIRFPALFPSYSFTYTITK